MKLKNHSGITLVALVVTIVVLLILSGVIVSGLTSKNGIITKAKITSFTSEMSQVREIVDIEKIARNNRYRRRNNNVYTGYMHRCK